MVLFSFLTGESPDLAIDEGLFAIKYVDTRLWT